MWPPPDRTPRISLPLQPHQPQQPPGSRLLPAQQDPREAAELADRRSSSLHASSSGRPGHHHPHSSSSNGGGGRASSLIRCGDEWLEPALLTARIKAARSSQQLADLLGSCCDATHLNQLHTSALVTHLAQLNSSSGGGSRRGDAGQAPSSPGGSSSGDGEGGGGGASTQALLAQLMPLLEAHLPVYDARGLANVAWALSSLDHRPSKSWLARFATTTEPLLAQCSAQQLANTLWALARWGALLPPAWWRSFQAASLPTLSNCQPQAASNMLWAAASLGLNPSEAWVHAAMAAAAGEHQQQQQQQAAPSPQALANALWACAKLRAVASDGFLRGFAQRASQRGWRDQLTSQGVANCLWALAAMQQQHQQELGPSSSSGGSSSSDGGSSSGGGGTSQCVQLLVESSSSRLSAFSNQDLSMTILALGKLQHTPPQAWQDAFWGATAARAGQLSGQQLANMLAGAGRLRLAPPPAWLADLLDASADQLTSWSAEAQAGVLLALGSLGQAPPTAWLARLLGDLQRRNYGSAPAALTAAVHGLALLGHAPSDAWLTGYLATLRQRLQLLSGRQLGTCLWALGRLRWRPDRSWGGVLADAVAAAAPGMALGELAVCLQAVLRLVPGAAAGGAAAASWRPALAAALAAAEGQLLRSQQAHGAAGGVPVKTAVLLALAAARLMQGGAAGVVRLCTAAAAAQSRRMRSGDVAMLLGALALSQPALAPARLAQQQRQQRLQDVLLQAQQQPEAASEQEQRQEQLGTLASHCELLLERAQQLAGRQQLWHTDCAMLVWAAARLRLRVSPEWVRAVVGAFGATSGAARRTQAQQRRQRTGALLLWSLSRMGYHPGGSWLQRQLAGQQHEAMTPADTVATLQALAALRHRPGGAWTAALAAASAPRLRVYAPRELAQLLWAAGALRLPLPAAWVGRAATEAAANLGRLSTPDLGMAVWGLARLGAVHCLPGELCELLLSDLLARSDGALLAGRLSRSTLVELLETAGLLAGAVPAQPGWVAAAVRALGSEFGGLDSAQLVAILGALPRMRCRPPEWWLQGVLGALAARRRARALSARQCGQIALVLGVLRAPQAEEWAAGAAVVYRPTDSRGGVVQRRPKGWHQQASGATAASSSGGASRTPLNGSSSNGSSINGSSSSNGSEVVPGAGPASSWGSYAPAASGVVNGSAAAAMALPPAGSVISSRQLSSVAVCGLAQQQQE